MINRNFVLTGACTLTLLALQSAEAMPAIPAPDAPPVTAQMTATYYTNVAGSSEALATARGLKLADEVYNPSINLNLVEPMGGISLFLIGQAGYNFYQQNSVLDGESINLQGGANARLGVCDATASGAWSRYQSNPADLLTVTTKNIQQLFSGELDARCDQLGNIIPSASVSQTWSNNSALIYTTQDYHSFSANASVAYKREPIGTISLIGQYTQTAYPHRAFALGTGPEDDGYDLYSGGIRFERAFGATLNLSASVSETSLSTNDDLGKGFNGITYNASLSYHPTARLNFNLALNREVDPGSYLNGLYGVNEVYSGQSGSGQTANAASVINGTYTGQALNATYGINETYSGQASYRVTSRLTATLGASAVESNFAGAAIVPGIDITAQTIRSFYGALAFNASPTFSVSLNVGEDQRSANVIGYSYSGAHVGLAVSKAF